MLPKFLLADNSQELPETVFIVHTQEPRFIVGGDIDDFYSNREIHWIDPKPANEITVEQLLDEAEDFMEREFECQEDLYDEDFGLN